MTSADYLRHVIWRNNRLSYKVLRGKNRIKQPKIVGLIRMRNEELILQDTLDHLSGIVDGIVVFDDASTDHCVEIAKEHKSVLEVIVNKKWHSHYRAWEETANRKLLLERSRKYHPEWFFYVDADERFEGDIKDFLNSKSSAKVDIIRIQLFDAYMTNNDKEDFIKGDKLLNFRKYFGIERRDIAMIWRNLSDINYNIGLPDMREPDGLLGKKVMTKFYCQHYGKAISAQQWENTCDYYVANFPGYAEKWRARKGKAIHTESDFGTKLLTWREVKENGGIKIN